MQPRIVALLVLLAGLAVAVVLTTVGGDEESGGEAPTRPEVEVPDGPPPDELEATDLTEGEGTEAQEGDTVSVHYVGVNYSNGEEFDASWDVGQPFELQLGAGDVIPGWEEGIPGMKVGGRRQLVIPPELGYGRQGRPPEIPPNETLVFVIDLLEVRAGP